MEKAAIRNLTLRIVGFAGATLFAFFFALTYHTPRWVEDFAAEYIEALVAQHVDATIERLGPPTGGDAMSRYAARLYEKNQTSISGFKELLKKEAREQLVDCIDKARSLSVEARATLERLINQSATGSIGALQLENARLASLIQSGYLQVVADLQREIRIFTASNAIAFLLLVLASFLRPEFSRELFVPGILLAISTLICTYLYVFEQDWLLTMIHGDYLGVAYVVYLGFVFLILCDIVLNRARVTIKLIRLATVGF